jgi:copper resistance protein C
MMIHSIIRQRAALVLLVILIAQTQSLAHAFIDHADPKVGSVVDKPPDDVKVWFTEEIEPAFSSLQVFDSDGKQVDRKEAHLDPKDKTLLIVSLPHVPFGEYKVVWSVVAKDTHKTHGDFKFTVKP